MSDQNEYENLVEHEADSVQQASIFQLIIKQIFAVKHSPHFKLILLRLPSLILADILIHNSSSVYDYFFPVDDSTTSSMSLMTFLITYTISRGVMLFALLTCFLLFTLSLAYVINIYKVMMLFSLPFLFTYLMNLCYSYEHSSVDLFVWNSIKPWLSEQIVILVLVCLSYSFIVSMTILLYNDIYKTIIFDKYNLRQLNLLNPDVNTNGNANMQRLADFQYHQMFASHNTPNPAADANDQQDANTSRLRVYTFEEMYTDNPLKWFFVNFRRVYILSYSVLSLVVNEFSLLFNNSDEMEDKQPYNIMSLGNFFYKSLNIKLNGS